MGKQKDVGVFQMDNGAWAYRFKIKVDGQEISRRKTTDEYGGKLRSKGAAIKAREGDYKSLDRAGSKTHASQETGSGSL